MAPDPARRAPEPPAPPEAPGDRSLAHLRRTGMVGDYRVTDADTVLIRPDGTVTVLTPASQGDDAAHT